MSYAAMDQTEGFRSQQAALQRQPATLDLQASHDLMIIQRDNSHIVTKYFSEINFVSHARKGHVIELGIEANRFGKTGTTDVKDQPSEH